MGADLWLTAIGKPGINKTDDIKRHNRWNWKYEKQKNGKYFAFMMDIENLQNKRKSVMIVDQFQLGSELTESSFSTTNLNK